MCWKSRFAIVLIFPKVFCLFGYQKVVYLFKRKAMCWKLRFSIFQSIWHILLSESGLFAQNKAFQHKCSNPNILNLKLFCVWHIWLSESGLFDQKAAFQHKCGYPNILNVMEIENWRGFSVWNIQLSESGLFSQKAAQILQSQHPKCAGN